MSGDAWWKEVEAGKQCQVVFVQVDLSGSSKWFESESTIPSIAEALQEFANSLKGALHAIKFDRLFWAGDGGVFCRVLDSEEDAHAVFLAADEIFRNFRHLQRINPQLKIRVSATAAPYVVVFPDPGNMCSSRLSAFIKYEREIALNNAFVITDELRDRMRLGHERVSMLQEDKRPIPLPTGETMVRWIDSEHPYVLARSKSSFVRWLSSRYENGQLPKTSIDASRLPREAVPVGESVILDTAADPSGYARIQLKQLSSKSAEEIIQLEDLTGWRAKRKELTDRMERGVKLTVSYFQGELTDHPYAELGWRQGFYEDAKAFNSLLEERGGAVIRDRYLATALKVGHEEAYTLGLLGNFVVVLLKGSEDRDILISHRRKQLKVGGRKGGFFGNCWSVSMEEQVRPIKETRDGKTYEADPSIKDGIVRGLQEEFLGEDYTTPMSVAVHAFILETTNLNYAFLSVVDLPAVSFDDLCKRWLTAPDRTEHDALAAIPLRAELVDACMLSEGIPPNIWQDIKRRGKQCGGESLSEESLLWHPSSQVRLAMALWYLKDLQ